MVFIGRSSFALLSLLCLHLSRGQQLTLSEYSSETNCTDGLLSGDTIIFKAYVDYSEDPDMKYVQFFIRKRSDSAPHKHKVYNLQEDCRHSDDCRRLNTSSVVINIKVTAENEYSDAVIFGKLVTSKSLEIYSDISTFPPRIYAASDNWGHLLVNGQEINTTSGHCNIDANNTYMNIINYICRSPVTPCVVKIITNNTTEPVQGEYGVPYGITVSDLSATLTYYPCGLDKFVNTLRCNISHLQTTGQYTPSNWTIFGIVILSCAILVLLSVTCGIICYNNRPITKVLKFCKGPAGDAAPVHRAEPEELLIISRS